MALACSTFPSGPGLEGTGVMFAQTSPDRHRSSTEAAKFIVAQALAPFNPEHANDARSEANWRRCYPRHIRRLVEAALISPEKTLPSAKAGLHAVWSSLNWKQGNREQSLFSAFSNPTFDNQEQLNGFSTVTVRGGEAGQRPAEFALPYKNQSLRGAELLRQAERWVRQGVIEESAAEALNRCASNPEWFDLSDRTMVLLGAGSEAGPLSSLLKWRANVVAVDLPRPAIWQKIAAAMHTANGTLHVPVRYGSPKSSGWTAFAGADILTDTFLLAAWLRRFREPLDVAALAYADGERHVRLIAAMDALQQAACEGKPDATLAFLATPTDVFAVPCAPAVASIENFNNRALLAKIAQGTLNLVTGGQFFSPNVNQLIAGGPGGDYGVVDSLIIQQGPNYALAKRIQQWRALVARDAGHRVSINIAPSTRTASVLGNTALAAGFEAASIFGVEVFEPATTNALMAALWVHDLRSAQSKANPVSALHHPLDLMADNACHGGLWRVRYRPRTALPFVAGIGWLRGHFCR